MADFSLRKTRRPASRRGGRSPHWRRDAVELAALFTAVTVADSVAKTIVNGPDGPTLLIVSALVLLATAGFHTWWARHHTHAPPLTGEPGGAGSDPAGSTKANDSAGTTGTTGTSTAEPGPGARDTGPAVLWRMRTTVRDEPGSLAALCTALAGLRIDILSLQTHPLGDVVVDEFLLRVPGDVQPSELSRAAAGAGGSGTWLERADAHDLVDAPTRVLGLAARTALDTAELPLALRQLLGRCTIRSVPAVTRDGRPQGSTVPAEGLLEETRMQLRAPDGGSIVVERPQLPFTPTEFARAHALVQLDAMLGQRVPGRRDVLTLPEGNEITVRRADTKDLAAAREMHQRCSTGTLKLRYHGPADDADRYLDHLLSPRFGRTLAVETASGRLVALGHLLWDGDETEVAVVVEDSWQRQGVGTALLRRLVQLASEAGCSSVYAVTQASNTGMVAAMRRLGLPLDYQIEDGTLVISAHLAPVPAVTPSEGH